MTEPAALSPPTHPRPLRAPQAQRRVSTLGPVGHPHGQHLVTDRQDFCAGSTERGRWRGVCDVSLDSPQSWCHVEKRVLPFIT